MSLPETPSQTVGPFFAVGLPWPAGPHLLAPDAPGAVRLSGRVLDGAGEPVPDALVEAWQPGAGRGFGRCATDPDGRWELIVRDAGDAGHVDLSIFARGLLQRLVTRAYLGAAPDPTLQAAAAGGGYHLDIRLQGEHETTFFEL